jgi:thiol-disulfide isomerase/thioredoxin
MKKIVIQCIALCLFSVTANAQFSGLFQLNGTLKDIADVDKVLLRYHTAAGERVDTIKSDNGKYSFSGRIEEPQLMQIWILHPPVEGGRVKGIKRNEVIGLYVNPGKIEAASTDEVSNIVVSGSGVKWNKDYQYLAKQQKLSKDSASRYVLETRTIERLVLDYKGPTTSYSAADKTRDSTRLAFIDKDYLNVDKRLAENVLLPYIKANPGSPLSLFALKAFVGERVDDYQGAKALYDSLSEDVRQMPVAKPFVRLMESVASASGGAEAPTFTLLDTAGKAISLASFKGKYVLLDFWASWCGPCRAENPHVVKLYSEYKNKGFTALSISIDTDSKGGKDAWKKAIMEDRLTWPQVLDDGKISKTYHITSVPQNFLINPEGKIIGKNLVRDELDAKLKELLK